MAFSDPPDSTPVLYVKAGCPWCEEVVDYLRDHRLPFKEVMVSGNPTAMAEMIDISGQRRAPTMIWGDEVLADFGVDELEEFLRNRP